MDRRQHKRRGPWNRRAREHRDRGGLLVQFPDLVHGVNLSAPGMSFQGSPENSKLSLPAEPKTQNSVPWPSPKLKTRSPGRAQNSKLGPLHGPEAEAISPLSAVPSAVRCAHVRLSGLSRSRALRSSRLQHPAHIVPSASAYVHSHTSTSVGAAGLRPLHTYSSSSESYELPSSLFGSLLFGSSRMRFFGSSRMRFFAACFKRY